MSKICGTCGAACEDNASACSNCGAPFATEKKSKLADICAKIPGLNKLQPKIQMLIAKIVMIAVPACIVGFIAVVAIILIVVNSGPKAALKDYFNSIAKTDVDAYVDLMPEEDQLMYNKLSDDYTIEDKVEVILKNKLDEYEEDYGHNIKFKVKVVKNEKMSNIALSEIQDDYAGNEDLADIKVKKGAEIDFEVTVKGKESEADTYGTAYLIKEDGKWKVYDINFDF